MRTFHSLRLFGLCCAFAGLSSVAVLAASSVSVQRDGTVQIAGRNLKCGSVRNVVDRRLPNLGMAGPGVLSVNPLLLDRQPQIVRLFVYHHECGHHHVGASELAADCWAVNRGARDGWLDKSGLAQICKSFGNGPATETHPAGQHRCASLDRCFAKVAATLAKERRAVAAAPATSAKRAEKQPTLLYGPKLVRSGTERDNREPVLRSVQ